MSTRGAEPPLSQVKVSLFFLGAGAVIFWHCLGGGAWFAKGVPRIGGHSARACVPVSFLRALAALALFVGVGLVSVRAVPWVGHSPVACPSVGIVPLFPGTVCGSMFCLLGQCHVYHSPRACPSTRGVPKLLGTVTVSMSVCQSSAITLSLPESMLL